MSPSASEFVRALADRCAAAEGLVDVLAADLASFRVVAQQALHHANALHRENVRLSQRVAHLIAETRRHPTSPPPPPSGSDRGSAADSVSEALRTGTRRDAVLFSAGANQAHGLQRTNADKRKAVESLLNDDEWRTWTQPEIAAHCGVSREFVSRVKSDMDAAGSLTCDRSQVSYTNKHGTVATMNTENIATAQVPA